MDDRRGDEPISLVGARLPPWCTRRVVEIAPGATRPFEAAEWRDALVVVDRGQVVLVGVSGSRLLIGPGAVFAVHGIDLRGLHNPGVEPAVLVAVSRRGPGRAGDADPPLDAA
jgi:hypothetical protein